MPIRKPKADYAIQTVANALRLFEEFRDEAEIGVADLSRRLALHKNNVFRLLATLEDRGYIEQDPVTERYRLGIGVLRLGQSYARNRPLLARARDYLERLSSVTGETAHLGLLDDFEVVHADGVAPDRMLVTGLRTGRNLPVHCTALGKVLIGCCPEGQREAYDRTVAADGSLAVRTPRTISDPDKFFEHIRTVAGQGFAIDRDECELGLCCAAAPVYDETGRVVAALSVSAPSARVSEDALLREICPRVVSAAEGLSRELGHAV
jgi:DNA-binding IclR family transcriptional regulator